jgi:hypothetical protein
MSISEYIWNAVVLVSFVALVFSACTADPRKEHYDTPCFRNIAICITGFILLLCYLNWTKPAPVTIQQGGYSPIFSIWNRSGYYHRKAGWQVTNYRKPSSHLSAPDYMMGVELVRSNACHYFNFNNNADIDHFKRCSHFFPEFLELYRSQFEERVGICI